MAEIKILTAGAGGDFTRFSGIVKKVTIKRDSGACDMLEAELAADEPRDIPSFVRLFLGEILLFDGVVDDMIFTADESGRSVLLVARDRLSLLTDNQMRPCALRDPSLRMLNEKYIKPFGFEAVGNMAALQGEMRIAEGTSVLKGLADYCRNFLGTEVKRRGSRLYCGEAPVNVVKDSTYMISIEKSRSLYGVPTKVFGRSSLNSVYSACRIRSEGLGFERVVYSDEPLSMEINHEVRLMLAGAVDVYPQDIYSRKGLDIKTDSVKLEYDGNSWVTRITGEEQTDVDERKT